MTAAGNEAAVGGPALSVVVVSVNDPVQLGECLASVRAEAETWPAQLIVARACGPEEVDELAARYPFARFVACGKGVSVQQLRAAGMRVAGGDVVAVTEDRSGVPAGWLEQLATGRGAVGETSR